MQANQVKPGLMTSEFLGVVVSMLVSTAVLFKLVPMEQAVIFQNELLQFLNLCVQIVTLATAAYMTIKPLVAYIKARLVLKQQQLQQSLAQTSKSV